MKNKTIYMAGGLILLAVIAFGGISGWGQGSDTLSADRPVHVGVIAGTTGQYAPAGEGFLSGFNLAKKEWNAVSTRKFTSVAEDDGFDAVKGLNAYKKISSIDKVDTYVVLSTFTIDAVYKDISQEHKPVVLGFEQSIDAAADNIFQIYPAGVPTQRKLGEHLKEQGYKKPIVVVSDNTAAYENFYRGFIEGYQGEALKIKIKNDITLIRSEALKITSYKPDVVIFFTAPTDGAKLVKELLDKYPAGSLPQLAFDQSIQSGSRDYKEILGGRISKIDGSLVSMSKVSENDDFKKKYEAEYKTTVPFGAAMGYNAFMILAQSYSNSGDEWIQKLGATQFAGADGRVEFDEKGLRVPVVQFGVLKGGEVL